MSNYLDTESYGRFIEAVRKSRPALASFIEHTKPLDFGLGGVNIGASRDSFCWDALHDRATVALIKDALADHFGQPVFFKLTEIKKGGRGWQQRA